MGLILGRWRPYVSEIRVQYFTHTNSHHFIVDVERFIRRNPIHGSSTFPTKILDLRNLTIITSTPNNPRVFGLRAGPHGGCIPLRLQARKVAAFAPVTMVAVIPQVFAVNAPPHILVPITWTAHSKMPDLVPVDLVWIGSPTQSRDYVSPDVTLLTQSFRISSNRPVSQQIEALGWTLPVDPVLRISSTSTRPSTLNRITRLNPPC